MEFEDQSAIRGKFNSNEIRPSWSHILGIFGRAKKEEEEVRRREEEEERYGNYLSTELGWKCLCGY